jgi:hypothetical protein
MFMRRRYKTICEVIFMSASSYISSCFDLLFDVLKYADNILVFLPFASLVICFAFTLVFCMIRGKYYD